MRRPRNPTMSADEQTGGKGKRGRPPAAATAESEAPGASLSSTRPMAAFRIPTPLHGEIAREALSLSMDLTSFVTRLLAGFMHHFGLPTPAVEEALGGVRAALGLRR